MYYPFKKTLQNCKQATLLSIKKAEGRITFMENVKLSYHLLFCDPCNRFVTHWKRLDGAEKQDRILQMPEEVRERIRQQIAQHRE